MARFNHHATACDAQVFTGNEVRTTDVSLVARRYAHVTRRGAYRADTLTLRCAVFVDLMARAGTPNRKP